jgi:hypothetical protein
MRHATTRPVRRTAAILAAALAAGALPLLGPAAPALAADGCLTEQGELYPLPVPPGCDDSTPPTTTILTTRPQPVAGWIRTTSIEIEFKGQHTDADADPIGYECQFYDSATPPATWSTCTTPFRATDLEQNSATPYTFRVRAVDSADDAIDLTAGFPSGEDTPDVDSTPAELVFRADATAPDTFGFLRTTYNDEAHPDAPLVLGQRAQVKLQSNEGGAAGSAYRCRLNGQAVRCGAGPVTLRDLRPGLQRFTAAAVDPAGNVDPTPFVQQLFVPRDLATGDAERTSSGDWRTVRSAGSFAGDYLQSSRYGATLRFSVRNVREILLLAPAGAGLGSVAVRVGQGRWTPVHLGAGDTERMKVYTVRDDLSGLLAGALQIRVTSTGKPVRVDAIVAR